MNTTPERPFSSPEEEIAWLRTQLEARPKDDGKEAVPPHEAAKEVLKEAASIPSRSLGSYALPDDDVKKKSIALEKEEHDDQINELMAIAGEKGIFSALKVVRGLQNPHLLDDFHDHLIRELLFGDERANAS